MGSKIRMTRKMSIFCGTPFLSFLYNTLIMFLFVFHAAWNVELTVIYFKHFYALWRIFKIVCKISATLKNQLFI